MQSVTLKRNLQASQGNIGSLVGILEATKLRAHSSNCPGRRQRCSIAAFIGVVDAHNLHKESRSALINECSECAHLGREHVP